MSVGRSRRMEELTMTAQEAQNYLEKNGLLAYLKGGTPDQLRPDYRDLARLHDAAVRRKAFTILEFGVGWSTVVLADALMINQQRWNQLPKRPDVRNRDKFKIFSVDTSRQWIDVVKGLIPPQLKPYTNVSHSEAEAGLFNGRMCHFFKTIPDVVPDFIYLDGPDPATVAGHINGMTWKNPDRTVVSGDILLMEPTLLPGTFIVIDGRTNNARFLQNNVQRGWQIKHDVDADITTMELAEPPLGRINRETLAYCLDTDQYGTD